MEKWSRVKGIEGEHGENQTLQTSSKYPCAVCGKGVGKNMFFCGECSFWVHKKCSDIPDRLVEEPDFRSRCLCSARAIDGRPCVEVLVLKTLC